MVCNDAVESIISCASDRNYTIYFFSKTIEKIVVSKILKEMEEMLEDYSFLRVHHLILLIMNEISKYVKGEGDTW
jgi:two-component system LytT family response regulator